MTATTATPDVHGELAARLTEMITGYQRTQLLILAAQLGLADLLADGPRTVPALAEATGSDEDALRRVIRALAAWGVFATRADGTIESSPLAALLKSGAQGSLRTLALAQQDFCAVWAELGYTVQTGRPSFDRVYGEPNWAYRQRHPDANERFNGFMAQHVRARANSLLRSGCLPTTGTVVDVGGGNGTLLAIVLASHPQLCGVLLDQPHVVQGAASVLLDAGVADRCDTVGGDFFAEVPPGGDLYVLSGVLWDWPDDRATAILRCCRDAMGFNARLVLVDGIIDDSDQPSPITNVDVQLMLTNAGARIRTAAQWHNLLTAAGFADPSTPTVDGVSNILVTARA